VPCRHIGMLIILVMSGLCLLAQALRYSLQAFSSRLPDRRGLHTMCQLQLKGLYMSSYASTHMPCCKCLHAAPLPNLNRAAARRGSCTWRTPASRATCASARCTRATPLSRAPSSCMSAHDSRAELLALNSFLGPGEKTFRWHFYVAVMRVRLCEMLEQRSHDALCLHTGHA